MIVSSVSVDISLYQGEDQLDEIERRRRGDEKRKKGTKKDDAAEDDKDAKKDKEAKKDAKKEVKLKVKPPPRKAAAPPEEEARVGRRVEKRKSAEKARDAFEFADFSEGDEEEEEEDVKRKPKKRKSGGKGEEKKEKVEKEKVEEEGGKSEKTTEGDTTVQKVRRNDLCKDIRRTFVDASVFHWGRIKIRELYRSCPSVIPPPQFCLNKTDAHLLLFTLVPKDCTTKKLLPLNIHKKKIYNTNFN